MHHRRAALHQSEQIAPFHCRKPCMEIILNQSAVNNCNLRRFEMEIDRLGQPERVPRLHEINMGDLPGGMDPRIGAPRRPNRIIALSDTRQGRLNSALDRRMFGLPLPSCESCAVVFDFKSISRHALCYRSKRSGAIRKTACL